MRCLETTLARTHARVRLSARPHHAAVHTRTRDSGAQACAVCGRARDSVLKLCADAHKTQVEGPDMDRVAKATGARVQTTVNGLDPAVLGTCAAFEERQVGAHPVLPLLLHCQGCAQMLEWHRWCARPAPRRARARKC